MGIDQFSFLESCTSRSLLARLSEQSLVTLSCIVVGEVLPAYSDRKYADRWAAAKRNFGGIMATIFAVSLDMEATADGVGAAMGLQFRSQYSDSMQLHPTFTFVSGMMAKADSTLRKLMVKRVSATSTSLRWQYLDVCSSSSGSRILRRNSSWWKHWRLLLPVLAGNGRSGCSRRRYEVRLICYPDESYDVRRNVGIPSCRFRNGTYLCSKHQQQEQHSPLCIRRCSYCNLWLHNTDKDQTMPAQEQALWWPRL